VSGAIDNLGIPPLAGVCTYEQAARPGVGVDGTVERLLRLNYVVRRLYEIGAAHLARTPEWEAKCGLGLHLWLDAEHGASIRRRVAEMREPPHRLDDVPDPRLEAAMEEAIRASDAAELLAGVYGAVRPAIVSAIEVHLGEMNPLFDHPTHRLLRTMLRDEQEMVDWGETAARAVAKGAGAEAGATRFAAHVRTYLDASGGILGNAEPATLDLSQPPRWDGTPFRLDPVPRRDARFRDVFNATALIDEYAADDSRPPDERALALACKRLREMDVPEWMAAIVAGTPGKQWDYYRDLARQLWDETRHAMMGETALVAAGVPFYDYPVDMAASASLNTEFTPLEAHLLLWHVEQGLMARETGKRFEWTVARLDVEPLYAALQDYDWADEVLHAQIGRRWLADDFGSAAERRAAAEEALARWREALERLATTSTQEEWWPGFVERVRALRDRSGARDRTEPPAPPGSARVR
jgi:hypothetical protein